MVHKKNKKLLQSMSFVVDIKWCGPYNCDDFDIAHTYEGG